MEEMVGKSRQSLTVRKVAHAQKQRRGRDEDERWELTGAKIRKLGFWSEEEITMPGVQGSISMGDYGNEGEIEGGNKPE